MKAKTPSYRNLVHERFAAEPERAWTAAELGRALNLTPARTRNLARELRAMSATGEIVELRPGRFGPGAPADLLTGALTVMRNGSALVRDRAGGDTVWVRPEDQSTALPGDTVRVRLHRTAAGDATREGRVVRLIERSPHDIVGTLQSTGRFFYVVPLNPVYRQDFYVSDTAGAAIGDRVVLRFSEWANRHVNPEGEIVDVIGPADRPSLDTETIVRQFHLPAEFPEDVLREAEAVATRLAQPGRREDGRDLWVLTIDPATARDFDDALSLTRDPRGRRVLGVHIADVSHFVRPGTALDDEARERGTSVYLVDQVLPMLPEQLSNGVCSLRPGEDRLTFSAFLTFDDAGAMIERRFARTRIRSRLRLQYAQAQALIEGRAPAGLDAAAAPPDLPDRIGALHHLAQQLRARRFRNHALDLEVPECEITLDAGGVITGVRLRASDPAHQLIEECMVAANEAVATELSVRGIAILSRLHEPPDPEKIEALQVELRQCGFEPGDLSTAANLAAFVRSVEQHPLRYHVHMQVLRSLKRAVYSSEAGGHFGLGKPSYAHFTSPIRRYPDLVLHRQLAAYLAAPARARFDRAELKAIATLATEREQRAEDASRALIEIKKFRYLQQQIDDRKPEVYDAVAVKVMNFGLFVDVLDLQISGLVHVSSISERFVHFDRGGAALRVGRQSYRAGQKLRVFVIKVDFNKRQADFALDPGHAPDAKPPPQRSAGRKPRFRLADGGGNRL